MAEDFFDLFGGNDFPISLVLACIIIFIVFLCCATIANREDKKDIKPKAPHDEDDT